MSSRQTQRGADTERPDGWQNDPGPGSDTLFDLPRFDAEDASDTQRDVDPEPCDPDPCEFGECRLAEGGFECDCTDGYDGDLCEVNIDDCAGDDCGNGECVDGVVDFICECRRGWDGAACLINPDDCLDSPCQNEGLCFDGLDEFACRCRVGWDGPACQVELDSCDFFPCRNDAPCSNLPGADAFDCDCSPGFFGVTCADACDPGRCVGAVTCEPATGEDRDCPEGCVTGFAGRECGIDLRTCDDDPCFTTVTCVEVPGERIECGPCPDDFEGDGERCIPSVAWFETFGDPNDDVASGSGQNMDIAVDSSDNIYALGTFGGDFRVGGVIMNVGRFGGYVAKFTAEGEFVWATQFSSAEGSINENSPLEILIHPISGDVILSGNAAFTVEMFVGGELWGSPNSNSSATAICSTTSQAHPTGRPSLTLRSKPVEKESPLPRRVTS